jgi:uncharacterized DUF497 family protein
LEFEYDPAKSKTNAKKHVYAMGLLGLALSVWAIVVVLSWL